MQEGGVVMDVVTAEQAHVAEDSGAVSVMALERVPADIRAAGGCKDEPPSTNQRNHGDYQYTSHGQGQDWT